MSRKKQQKSGLASQLPLAIKTGKYVVGFNQTLKSIIHEKAHCVILADNIPEHMRRRIEYYCVLANNTPIEYFPGDNNALNLLAGVSKRCSVISVLEQGEADFAENKA
ncbi:RL30 [Enterospora canceri]|uniref:RL30 n=1 Tax=Enterospora canceri TaxID=1081671 RepID=A0A1Y1S6L3_9MICR|nr:RL30 [Enterospora canceri]